MAKPLTARSDWRLSLPHDSQALRRRMEVIRSAVVMSHSSRRRRSHLYFWLSLTEAAAPHSRLRWDVGGAFGRVGAGRRRESSRVFVPQLLLRLIDTNLIVAACFPGKRRCRLSISKLTLKVGVNFVSSEDGTSPAILKLEPACCPRGFLAKLCRSCLFRYKNTKHPLTLSIENCVSCVLEERNDG